MVPWMITDDHRWGAGSTASSINESAMRAGGERLESLSSSGRYLLADPVKEVSRPDHAGAGVGLKVGQRVSGGEARIGELPLGQPHLAGHGDHRHAVPGRCPGDSHRRLAAK